MPLLLNRSISLPALVFSKIKQTAVLTILYTLLLYSSAAQTSVRGTVSDLAKKPLQYVVVSLHRGNAVIGNEFTDSAGSFQFKNLKRGDYKFFFSFVSYNDTVIPATINTDTVISLQFQSSKLLKGVEVLAKKPIIQMETDRLRFNVSGPDLVFGNNIWDVIEKTPLVNTSSDGTIQISGTSGAVVYINNKKKILSGSALKSYLSAIPSDNLEAIEVITTPSSKYDAEGGAGILNIITKKKKEDGFDGNAVLSARQTATTSESGSLFLNGRSGKWNVYSNLYMVNRKREPLSSQDFYFPSGGNDSLLTRSINAPGQTQTLSSGLNAGIDFQINANHVAGLIVDYSGSRDKKSRDAFSQDRYAAGDSLTFSDNKDKLTEQTFSLNLNYEGKLDSSGKTFSLNFDALCYTSENNSISKTDALNTRTKAFLFVQDYFRSSSPQKVGNQSLKADFHWPFNEHLALDFGAKISFSSVNNDLLFENNTGNDVWAKDNSRSNLFKYDENISAAYAILHRTINAKWAYQVGLRLENTLAKGYLEGLKVVNKNYTNLFPTGFLKYAPTEHRTYVLAISSRITRPSYWDVNPFRAYTTDKTYFEGNPFLLPSKYYREELKHTLIRNKGSYTFQLAASQTVNEFYSLPYNDSGNIVINKKVNYGNKQNYSATAIYYSKLFPWWQLSGTVLLGYVISKGAYANVVINNKSILQSVSANQTFTISKKHKLSCTIIVNNTLPYTIVNTRVGDRLETEIRFRKTAGPLNITVAATDLFKSNKDAYTVHANDLKVVESFYYDTRSVALTLSYNFGKSTVREKRDRDTEFEDVKGRIM